MDKKYRYITDASAFHIFGYNIYKYSYNALIDIFQNTFENFEYIITKYFYRKFDEGSFLAFVTNYPL